METLPLTLVVYTSTKTPYLIHLPSNFRTNKEEEEVASTIMALATARAIFSFHHLHPSKPSRSVHLHVFTKLPTISTSTRPPSIVASSSLDVSKDDKPLPNPTEVLEEEREGDINVNSTGGRLEEKFAVIDTGIHECRSCGYRYNEASGDPAYPIPPGLQFGKLPEDWRCPTCGAAKSFFVSKSVEIAGFAENQQFGLGGNTLTSGQKALLIYGSLLLAFGLFLSGYFLQ